MEGWRVGVSQLDRCVSEMQFPALRRTEATDATRYLKHVGHEFIQTLVVFRR